jgi:putative transcriptional regulator
VAIRFDKLFTQFEKKGITTYTLRKDKIVGNETFRKLKSNTGVIDTRTIDRLCNALGCQPGDIMEHVPDERDATKGVMSHASS